MSILAQILGIIFVLSLGALFGLVVASWLIRNKISDMEVQLLEKDARYDMQNLKIKELEQQISMQNEGWLK